jgi:hypothetical protein
MHSAYSISEWPTHPAIPAVILSAADTSQSELSAESKDPYPPARSTPGQPSRDTASRLEEVRSNGMVKLPS